MPIQSISSLNKRGEQMISSNELEKREKAKVDYAEELRQQMQMKKANEKAAKEKREQEDLKRERQI